MSTQSNAQVGAIILAAGKGTRMKSSTQNKVSLEFHGRPIITYAVEIMKQVTDDVVVVVGAMADTVKSALAGQTVEFALQIDPMGTGQATQVGYEILKKHNPNYVLVGYGDHMMFYKAERLKEFIQNHIDQTAVVSLMTTVHASANTMALGRIIRDAQNNVIGLVEQNDATEEQKKIQEINPGFYCFNAEFLEEFLPKITKSTVTNEYYLTELLQLASKNGQKIVALKVPFEEVGIGVNKEEELRESQMLYSNLKKN